MLRAEFINGIDEITVKGLTQWDSGQEIEIVLAELPASFEVHFAHFKTDREAYVLDATVENDKAVVKIPNILLKYATNAVAWIFLVDGEARKTVKTINLPIAPRPQPSDYVYEETEVRTIYIVVEEALRKAKESGEFDGKYVLSEDEKKEIANMIKGKVKIGEVTLLASAWVGENNLYSQIVEIEGVTEYSQVDLTPDIQQLAIFYNKDITFVTENEDGVVTVYVIGQKPTNDYTIQVTITEVSV